MSLIRLVSVAGLVCISGLAGAQDLRVEALAPEQGFTVGTDSITLIGVVKNAGSQPVPAETYRGRLFALSGLDYVSGDTTPKLPLLPPGASASFKWRLRPLSEDSALVVSFALDAPSQPPIVCVSAIPHLATMPPPESSAVVREPSARTSGDVSILENSRVRARVLETTSGAPLLLLSSHTPGGWRKAGTCTTLAGLMAAEGGQLPWWEAFKPDDIRSSLSKTEATLELSGTVGVRWRATVVLKVFVDSSVVEIDFRASSSRPMKLFGLRLAPLLAGDGSFGAASSEILSPTQVGFNTTSAVRWGAVTVGAVHPNSPPFPNMAMNTTDGVEGVSYRLIGEESTSPGAPAFLEPGAMVHVRARLFAISPSASVQEALKVSLPGGVESAAPARMSGSALTRGRNLYPSRGGAGLRRRGSSSPRIR